VCVCVWEYLSVCDIFMHIDNIINDIFMVHKCVKCDKIFLSWFFSIVRFSIECQHRMGSWLIFVCEFVEHLRKNGLLRQAAVIFLEMQMQWYVFFNYFLTIANTTGDWFVFHIKLMSEYIQALMLLHKFWCICGAVYDKREFLQLSTCASVSKSESVC